MIVIKGEKIENGLTINGEILAGMLYMYAEENDFDTYLLEDFFETLSEKTIVVKEG
ncbi:hypothetical protein HZY83_07440 [Gemella sp. GH3]|uniref:hypothetical protein n=1 Tax=unclassified Gemella TaxID=2624949 RepID=UPI0015D03F82|nr:MULTISPECIES: hypothetical protein [unclassified Gemella]MBF0714507.1 hypothetical protein [Gemella sp. GH3.1]NYS51459.1 hypothetical protein [Gemella sp. GH3]